MRGRKVSGREVSPFLDRRRQGFRRAFTQMPFLRIGAYKDRRFKIRQRRHQILAPGACAFFTGWQIAAFGVIPWKTKSHGNNCNALGVVEFLIAHAHPGAQAFAGRIGKRTPALMDEIAGRLPEYAEPRRFRHLQDRPRLMRQRLAGRRFNAQTAFTYFLNQRVEFCGHLTP